MERPPGSYVSQGILDAIVAAQLSRPSYVVGQLVLFAEDDPAFYVHVGIVRAMRADTSFALRVQVVCRIDCASGLISPPLSSVYDRGAPNWYPVSTTEVLAVPGLTLIHVEI